MAARKNNEALRQHALSALADSRTEIGTELLRLRLQLSPTHALHRAVNQHTGLTLLTAVAAGIIPVVLMFGGQRMQQHTPYPITINTNKLPSKPLLSALFVGALGMLAKAVTPALVKSAVVAPLLSFLAQKRDDAGSPKK